MNVRTFTRSLLHCSFLLAALVTPSFSQTDYSNYTATQGLTIGLGYAGGISMTTDPAENWKVSPTYSWKTGVEATYPVTPVISPTLGLGVDKRGGHYYWYLDNTVWEQRKVTYFSITPGIRFSSFYLGLNLGIPMGGEKRWQNGTDGDVNVQDLDSDKDQLLMMVEPQIGAVVPLLDEEIGWLGLTLYAGYNLNNLSDASPFIPNESPQKPRDTRTPSLRLGLTWQFLIPGTARSL